MPRLAAAVLAFERMQRRAVEAALIRAVPASGRVLYLESVAYDETPLPVQLRNEQLQVRLAATAPAEQPETCESAIVESESQTADFAIHRQLKLSTAT